MTIVYSTDLVDVIDCASAFGIQPWYRLRHNDFALDKPFFRTKLVAATTTATTTCDTSDTDSSSKKPALSTSISPKKKRRVNGSETDVQTQERHDHLLPFLLSSLDHATLYWQKQKDQRQNGQATNRSELTNEHQNNGIPEHQERRLELDKTGESTLIQFPDWIPMATASRRFAQSTSNPSISLDQEQQDFDLLDVFDRMIKNDSSGCRNIQLGSHGTFIIPPYSQFVMGDLETIDDLLQIGDEMAGYDLVVMDPPWPNKSVHRSSHYETQDIYDLYQIPLTSLVHRNSLVAVWITNKPKYRRFVMDKLFKSWHVECVGEWTWLKVTDDGEPVFPLNSTHRKPYEQLIIGRYHGGGDNVDDQSKPKPIPYQHSIISVPSKRHSRKPPLQDILKSYLPTKPKCLELFARALTPGWTSWGNECLKFQNEYYYTRIDLPFGDTILCSPH